MWSVTGQVDLVYPHQHALIEKLCSTGVSCRIKVLLNIVRNIPRPNNSNTKTRLRKVWCPNWAPIPIRTPPHILNGNELVNWLSLSMWVYENFTDDVDLERQRRKLSVRCRQYQPAGLNDAHDVIITVAHYVKTYCQYTSNLWSNYTKRVYRAHK